MLIEVLVSSTHSEPILSDLIQSNIPYSRINLLIQTLSSSTQGNVRTQPDGDEHDPARIGL